MTFKLDEKQIQNDKAFQYSDSTLFMCFERSAAGALKDAAMQLNIIHTVRESLCFCATALMVPVMPPKTYLVHLNRKAYFKV